MHRLKKWFGIKDWDGPPPNQENPKTTEPQNLVTQNGDVETNDQTKQNRTDSQPVKQVSVPNIVRPENESIYFKYNRRIEDWLKQYVVVGPDECAQCKVVAVTFQVAIGWGLAYYMYITEKAHPVAKAKRKYYRLLLISFSTVVPLMGYQNLFKKGIFQKRLEGETFDEFHGRIIREDLEWYKYYIRKVFRMLEGGTESGKTDD